MSDISIGTSLKPCSTNGSPESIVWKVSALGKVCNLQLLETLRMIKLKNGMIGNDNSKTVLDEKGRITFGYVDDNNQIIEVKIPFNGVEVDRIV